MKKYSYNGTEFNVYPSKKKNKQLTAKFKDGTEIDFGDPSMPEYPGKKRGDAYCARSSGIGSDKSIKNANTLSRKVLWKCKGKKSMDTFQEAGLK